MKGAHIAILVYNYFEQQEYEQPKHILELAGCHVSLISASVRRLQAMNGFKLGGTAEADELLTNAKPSAYNALLLPGGVINADYLRMDQTARQWVSSFLENEKSVAAICHGPWLLVSADLVEERRLTSYYTLQDDIRNAGGEWVDYPVITDGNLITAQGIEDIPAFCDSLLQQMHLYSAAAR